MKLYIVRHCEAEGQAFGAGLTNEGFKQAQELVGFFSNKGIEKIISSPYKRAVDTITPLAKANRIEIKIDDRLSERVLSTRNLPDWQEKLKQSFTDLDMVMEGGESSKQAMERVLKVVDEQKKVEEEEIVLVTHGNLLALLLKQYLPSFGYKDWETLSNPDVYLIETDQETTTVKRLWK